MNMTKLEWPIGGRARAVTPGGSKSGTILEIRSDITGPYLWVDVDDDPIYGGPQKFPLQHRDFDIELL